MPKISPIPRLSIVVPVTADMAAFEETLLSVLENRPGSSEVLVAHDGGYDDPFDLSDEVRFVIKDSTDLTTLVAASADKARGRFVHVLAPGMLATSNWADAALEQFERSETGVVAPVIRHADAIVAAGWRDTAKRLFQPIAAGQSKVNRSSASHILGAYLQASFWRRDVLRSVVAAFDAENTFEANYAYGRLLIASGWRCELAAGSEITSREQIDFAGTSSYARGQRLWAIKKSIDPTTSKVSWLTALTDLFSPAALGETIGQIKGQTAVAQMKQRLKTTSIAQQDDGPVVTAMPNKGKPSNLRRAA